LIAMSRLRASDGGREETVALLGRAAAEGRIDLHELELRVERAYAATARDELIQLLQDLPRAQLRAREDARAQWRASVRREEAAVDLVAFVGRSLEAHGYSLGSRTHDRIVFTRKRRRAWLQPARFLLPLRLLARLRVHEAVIFELHDHGQATTIIASGQAPPEVWRALAALER
jgi:hypothetical protein